MTRFRFKFHAVMAAAMALFLVITLLPNTAPAQAAATASNGTQVALDKLKKISRMTFRLKDAYRVPYTVYIYANDEKMSVLQEEDYWTGNHPGDKSYLGTYRAALVKDGQSFGTVQNVPLELHSVTLPQTWHYTVQASSSGMPDLLILTEWGSSNFNLLHPFIVTSGKLKALNFTDSKGKKLDTTWPAGREQGVRSLNGSRIQLRYYNNAMVKYAVDTFKLDISRLALKLDDTRYMNKPAWPNSGIGDRAYLESLRSAAVKGELPGHPQVKLGMSLKSASAKLNRPQSKENGEWGAFYGYSGYAVGFDYYLHELSAKSSVMIFNVFVSDRNLAPFNVRQWLGQPKEAYFNEEDARYEMVYAAGSHSLVFYYDEEDPVIPMVSIY